MRDPVFFIEVNHEDYDTRLFAPSAAKRVAADKQMRARYEDLLCLCSLPKLYGLSMMGTNMRVYVDDATLMTIDPPPVPRTTDVLPRTYLENAWSVDILSEEGFGKMQEIVHYIKTTPLNSDNNS
ncbi:hypothetical protein D9613_010090 [Agrocybe pediades]|uniref:Uncharacterized protein n=1 Tax=Agrocybe pediades TaxID=84607 RepID=A0A8H4VSN9_9AGAR|nr:hypothetical protein D9613_010090 [Agrocybe pediades]